MRPFSIAAIVLIAAGMTAGAHAAEFTMKVASVTTNDVIHEYMNEFERRIEDKSGGRIDAQVYPSGQLGSLARLVEGTQLGTIEMDVVASAHLKGVDRRFQAVDIPGLFESIEHANKALQDPSFRDAYLALGEPKGLKGISLFTYGAVGYASVKPIKTLADFEGLKIRVLATDIETGILESVGATGVQVPWLEILPSLQNGTIEGVRTNVSIMTPMNFYLGAKHLTTTGEGHVPIGAFVSMAFYEKLPPDLQQTLLEVGREMEAYMGPVAQRFTEEAEAAWQKNGGEIIRLSAEDQAEFIRRSREVGAPVFGAADPETRALYETLLAAAAKYEP